MKGVLAFLLLGLAAGAVSATSPCGCTVKY
jgi:hypothetical protein